MKTLSPCHHQQSGFTLLEIMLVVGIIVIILGVAVTKLGNTTGIAKDMAVRSDIQTHFHPTAPLRECERLCPHHGSGTAGVSHQTEHRAGPIALVSALQRAAAGSVEK